MTQGAATSEIPANGLLGLIADFYLQHYEDDGQRAFFIRQGTLADAIKMLMEDLEDTTAAYAAEQGSRKQEQRIAELEAELAEVKRPLDAEMARLNNSVINLNAKVVALCEYVERLRAIARQPAPLTMLHMLLAQDPMRPTGTPCNGQSPLPFNGAR